MIAHQLSAGLFPRQRRQAGFAPNPCCQALFENKAVVLNGGIVFTRKLGSLTFLALFPPRRRWELLRALPPSALSAQLYEGQGSWAMASLHSWNSRTAPLHVLAWLPGGLMEQAWNTEESSPHISGALKQTRHVSGPERRKLSLAASSLVLPEAPAERGTRAL